MADLDTAQLPVIGELIQYDQLLAQSLGQYQHQHSKASGADVRSASTPHLTSLYIYAYGQTGIGVTPDLRWPDKTHIRCVPAHQLLDYQARSNVQQLTDSNGALRMDQFRSLGPDGKSHCLFYLHDEVLYEQAAYRPSSGTPAPHHSTPAGHFTWSGSAPGLNLTDPDPYYDGYANVPRQRGSMASMGYNYASYGTHRSSRHSVYGQSAGPVEGTQRSNTMLAVPRPTSGIAQQGPIYGERENWRNIARGRQPPFRLYYPEIVIELASQGGLSCTQHATMHTLTTLLNNLTVSQGTLQGPGLSQVSRSARCLTFAGCDFSVITADSFADFLKAHTPNLDEVNFDATCTSLQQVRMALSSVYEDDDSFGPGGPINFNLPPNATGPQPNMNGNVHEPYHDYLPTGGM